MDYILIGILIVMGYLIVYSLVDRVCRCFENCANAKAFGKIGAGGGTVKKEVKEVM